MRQPGLSIVTAAGVCALAMVIFISGRKIEDGAASAAPIEIEQIELEEDGLETEAIPDPVPTVTQPARPVAQDRIAPVGADGAMLERIDPRPPLGELALAMPPKPGVPEPLRLHGPVATAAGRIEAQGHTVELEGIEVVEPERRCAGADGAEWPCGMIARTAFRNFLRGRAIECVLPEAASPDVAVTSCRLGEQDLAAWLVTYGYADASAGSPFEDLASNARRERLGIFGSGPSMAMPPLVQPAPLPLSGG